MTSILFVTDAWRPQINGVVRALEQTIASLKRRGIRTCVIEPSTFTSVPCPTYPDIRLSLTTARRVGALMDAAKCDHIHIATEGPLGLLAGIAARRRGRPYSTSYHTRFPEYLAARMPVPKALSYAWLRRFHNRASACLVTTPSVRDDLQGRGFRNVQLWGLGVDVAQFRPDTATDVYADLARPIFLYVGRVSVEKSLPDFLDLSLPGTKVVVGDGPALQGLRARYPSTVFLGAKQGAELATHFSSADVFVFPSRTDTFGLVMLEAMASGVPVAAFPVPGPRDVVLQGRTGILATDLAKAALAALHLPRDPCRAAVLSRSWEVCTDRFLEILFEAEPGVSHQTGGIQRALQ